MLAKREDDRQIASIDQIASSHGIPLYDVRRPLEDEFAKTIRQFSPDLIVSSCFPWRIPRIVREMAKYGGINLHPSLLPLHRGPDPLFRTFQAGEHVTGATVHELSDDFDAGAIYEQSEVVELTDGIPGDRLEQILADFGANLLVDVINRLETDRADRKSQDTTKATYESWPSYQELEIDRTWSVQRTLNFVAGVIPLGYEPWVKTNRGNAVVSGAWRVESNPEALVESWSDHQTVLVVVADGVVELKITE